MAVGEAQQVNEAETKLLRSALTLFSEKGYEGTSIREIIEGAGVTRPVLYYYFENKEELFKEMVRHIMLPHLAETEQRAEQHQGSMRELLETLLRARFERMSSPPFSGMPKLIVLCSLLLIT